MWPIVNVALQGVLGKAIGVLGLAGAQATAMNLAGQTVIHGLAVASGPIGWVISGASIAATIIHAL
jgi:uncharacterized protein YaaW (UPF0174 family)